MSNFFDRMLGRSAPKGSSSTAKDRLQFVLVHDRINLPPDKLREMKEEILAVISKYVSVDRERVDIALEQRERNSKLVAEIPFSRNMSSENTPTDIAKEATESIKAEEEKSESSDNEEKAESPDEGSDDSDKGEEKASD